MLVDLVTVTTPDSIPLTGAYFAPERRDDGLAADALIYLHGDGGHFYAPLYMELGQRFAERGLAFLTANRRGHDMVSRGAPGGDRKGYAYESVEEAPVDYASWLGLLRERGHRRIAIGGHSGGAVRSVYSQARERFDDVAAVVSVSPGEYHHETVSGLHGEQFTDLYQEAEKHLAEGRPDAFLRTGVPWDGMWTARTYVDHFNADNRYSVTAHAANTGCPTLFVFGSEECSVGGEQELPVCGAAMRRLKTAEYPHATVRVVEGANHGYRGREKELLETILTWLQKP